MITVAQDAIEWQPDVDVCSACREHCEFERSDDGEWLSNCCAAAPVRVDAEEGER